MRERGIGCLPCLPRLRPPDRPHGPSRDSIAYTTGCGCLAPLTRCSSHRPPASSAALRRPGMPRYRRPPPTSKRPPQAVGTRPGVNHRAWLKRCPRCATQAGAHPPPSSGRHRPGSHPRGTQTVEHKPKTRHPDDTDSRRTTCPTPAATAAREPRSSPAAQPEGSATNTAQPRTYVLQPPRRAVHHVLAELVPTADRDASTASPTST